MSTGKRLPLDLAEKLAMDMLLQLAPVVVRGKVVGSVRRKKEEVGDIELLVAPRPSTELLGDGMPDVASIQECVSRWGIITKGRGSDPRYIKLEHRDGFNVDIFICYPPAEWGCLLAIRTGPADFSRLAMLKLNARGYSHEHGGIYDSHGEKIAVPKERTFFELAGMPFLAPEQRKLPLPVMS